jgi:dephospho-CoA kinase
MLRVGLTGGLGSGKSTAAEIFHSLGAHVIKADTVGRDLMRPNHDVYDKIVAAFGPAVVADDGELNRPALARIVFEGEGAAERLDTLNAIVHPAVIAVQLDWMAQLAEREPDAVAIVESALIFETRYGETKRSFDRVILVVAPDEIKIARYVARTLAVHTLAGRTVSAGEQSALEADARHRLQHQIPDADKAARCDFILDNSGSHAELEQQVRRIYSLLSAEARAK